MPLHEPQLRRVRIYVPPTDVWPTTRRGVGSETACVICGEILRAKTHADARKALRFHNLDQHAALGREAVSAAREREGC